MTLRCKLRESDLKLQLSPIVPKLKLLRSVAFKKGFPIVTMSFYVTVASRPCIDTSKKRGIIERPKRAKKLSNKSSNNRW